ncbi:MAG TPA: D-glucuronyl C5-epimerase family protein [Gemmatimonadales bacterium]|jgi:hypothetical protein|nr:D-glucuronyl C5-epimerase family protein [Gemmatimonadales bacterium]
MRQLLIVLGTCLSSTACLQSSTAPTVPAETCQFSQTTDPNNVPLCLEAAHVISREDRLRADGAFAGVRALEDSLRADTAIASFQRASELFRAMVHVAQMYSRGVLTDSARFHRMIDHVLVTAEVIRGQTVRYVGGKIAPSTTPYLMWVSYPSNGIFFQPVSTFQHTGFLFVRTSISTDSLEHVGDAMWRYAIWRRHGGVRFPVWEYEFSFNSGGVTNDAPWISGQAQGLALIVYAELYRRTGEARWREYGYQVLNSFRVLWDDGGVMLPDTAHGYWWEEFSPYNQIWNGSAEAALGVGEFWLATDDPEVKRMFDRGIEAIKYNTRFYDTGSWTLYSRTQGYTTRAYHAGCIQILDAFFQVTGDAWFRDLADKWRAYVPPPGVN